MAVPYPVPVSTLGEQFELFRPQFIALLEQHDEVTTAIERPPVRLSYVDRRLSVLSNDIVCPQSFYHLSLFNLILIGPFLGSFESRRRSRRSRLSPLCHRILPPPSRVLPLLFFPGRLLHFISLCSRLARGFHRCRMGAFDRSSMFLFVLLKFSFIPFS